MSNSFTTPMNTLLMNMSYFIGKMFWHMPWSARSRALTVLIHCCMDVLNGSISVLDVGLCFLFFPEPYTDFLYYCPLIFMKISFHEILALRIILEIFIPLIPTIFSEKRLASGQQLSAYCFLWVYWMGRY